MSSAADAAESAARLRGDSRPGRQVIRAIQFGAGSGALSSLAFLRRLPPALRLPDSAGGARRRRSGPAPDGRRDPAARARPLRRLPVHLALRRDGGDPDVRRRARAPRPCRSSMLRLVLPASLHAWRVPLSIIVMDTVLAFGGDPRAAGRCAGRSSSTRRSRSAPEGADEPGAEAGAARRERAGRACSRRARSSSVGDMALEVKGFVDDDPAKQGSVIHGFPVLGHDGRPAAPRQGDGHRAGRHHDRPDLAARDPPDHRHLPQDSGQAPDHPGPLPDHPGEGAGLADPQRPDRGPARPRAGRARRGAGRPLPRGPDRHGHGRRRLDRLGAGAPGRAVQPGAPAPRRAGRVRALRDRPGAAALVSRALDPSARRRRRGGTADPVDLRRPTGRTSCSTRPRTSTCR